MTITRSSRQRCLGMDPIETTIRKSIFAPNAFSTCLEPSGSQNLHKNASRIRTKACADEIEFKNHSVSDRMQSWKKSMARSRARPRPPLKSLWTIPLAISPAPTSLKLGIRSDTSSCENRLKSCSPPSQSLFEEFLVIGIDLTSIDLNSISSVQSVKSSPKILFSYGCESHLSLGAAQTVSFVCPSGQVEISLDKKTSTKPSDRGRYPTQHEYIWSSQLTTSGNSLVQIFGICISQSELVTMIEPRSGQQFRLWADTYYCLTTRYPALETLTTLIKTLIDARSHQPVWISGPNLGWALRNQWDRSQIIHTLHEVKRTCVPSPGHHYSLNLDLGCIQGQRPASDVLWIKSWAIRKALGHSGQCQGSAGISQSLLVLIESVLRESSLVIVGENLGLTSSWVLLLTSAIYPLQWAGVCLPLLPDRWEDFLQSPVPIIAGVRKIPDAVKHHSDLVEWRPDCNLITIEKSYALTKPAKRCAETLQYLLPLIEHDPMITGRVIDLLSDYVKEIIERVQSDLDPMYDQFQKTQMWSYYLHTRESS